MKNLNGLLAVLGGNSFSKFVLAAAVLFSSSSMLAQSDVTLNPIHDAYLENGNLFNNETLRVESGSRVRETYLMFNLAGVDGTISNLELELTIYTDPGSGTINVYKGVGNDWTETNLSNSNKPSTSGSPLGSFSGTHSEGAVKTLTISPSELDGNLLSIVLKHTTNSDVAFGSTGPETSSIFDQAPASKWPKLKVTYTPHTDPANGYVKRINSGKVTAGDITYAGKTFSPDIPTSEGFEFTSTHNQTTTSHANFTLGGVFKPSRYTDGTFMQYDFPVTESGDYRVKLYFAEPWHGPGLLNTAANTRRFDIDIENGQRTETDFSIYEEAGNIPNSFTTVEETVQVTDGKVTIRLSRGSGNDPLINAIEVVQTSSSNIPVSSVSLNNTNFSLAPNATAQLTASISPNNATNQAVTWASSNSSIASVNSTGLVTAGSTAGNATITVTTQDGNKTASAAVAVTDSSNPPSGNVDEISGTGVTNIFYDGQNIGIGTDPQSSYRLAVEGGIRSREVKVDNDNWADYVFNTDYDLPTLEDVQKHIKEKGHLINIPSAADVEANGIELGEMNKLLLEKIEELTLYTIQQQSEIEELGKLIKAQK